MGSLLADNFPECQETFEQADSALGISLSSLCFEGPAERLMLTEYTQPALVAVAVAVARALTARGVKPALLAGHSLGEYSAHVEAGTLSFADVLRTVRNRGRYMQEAVPVNVGGMAAIIGMPLVSIRELCYRVSTEGYLVQPANLNSLEQIVIAGHLKAVEEVSRLASETGAKKVVMLPVSAPFHCSLMKPAEIKLQKELERTEFKNHQFPVVCNVDAQSATEGSLACDALVRQVCSPVRWVETMKYLVDKGIEVVVELGTGKVLSGLMRRFNKDIKCFQVGDPNSLQKTVEAYKKM